MISGKRDIKNMIVNPRILIKDSKNATEFITFERLNFFRMYIKLALLAVNTNSPRKVKKVIEKLEKWNGKN